MDKEILEEINYCLNCKNKPCQSGCPLGNDIPEMIRLIKENKNKDAYDVLTKTTLLSVACGRVCPHSKQCQGKCTRGIISEPVKIGMIEEWLAEQAIENDWQIEKFSDYEENKKKNLKVAIVGGGPAGLTCAGFLARRGIKVTIYEKHKELGGLLSHGIPEFRLNKVLLKKSINTILNLGIDVEYSKELNNNLFIEDLNNEYDAIFLAIGANNSMRMNIEGEKLSGVFGANELLEYQQKANYKGKNVVVIGGGNVAIDIARTAKRKGANSVKIAYRRTEEDMPAEIKEIAEAKLDGVQFLFQTNIVKIIDSDCKGGQVSKVECIKTKMIQKTSGTRKMPVNIDGSNFLIDADMAIIAIGSVMDKEIIKKSKLKINDKNYLYIDDKMMTSLRKVFAGGDLVGVKSTVAWAAKSGREAAEKIENMLLMNK